MIKVISPKCFMAHTSERQLRIIAIELRIIVLLRCVVTAEALLLITAEALLIVLRLLIIL